MRFSLAAVILALILFVGGLLYIYRDTLPALFPSPNTHQTPQNSVSPSQGNAPSSATNYDECIAEGNKPLPNAPDKCLTADGHLFIQGVQE